MNYNLDEINAAIIHGGKGWLERIFGTQLEEVPGTNQLKGLCPLHSETDPSFFVSFDNSRVYYTCFGSSCGKKGDLLKFVNEKYIHGIDTRGKTFFECIEKLLDLAGLQNMIIDKKDDNKKPKVKTIPDNFHDLNDEQAQHLIKRGIGDLKRFYWEVREKPFPHTKDTYEAYAISFKKAEVKTDFITYIPKKGEQRSVYLNPVGKMDYLFNYWDQPNRGKRLWLFEGPIKCLVFQDYFHEDSVAVLSTANCRFCDKTLEEMKKYGQIIVAYDNDIPGSRATWESVLTLYKNGFLNVSVVDFSKFEFVYKDFDEAYSQNDFYAINAFYSAVEFGEKYIVNRFIRKVFNTDPTVWYSVLMDELGGVDPEIVKYISSEIKRRL